MYGKKAGKGIPSPGNSKSKGPEAGLKGSVFGGQQGGPVWLNEHRGVRGEAGRRRWGPNDCNKVFGFTLE